MADPTSPTSPATDVRERVYLVVMPTKYQSRDLILKTLGTSDTTEVDLKDLADRIEDEIFKANNNSTDNTYRNSIRTHVLNLKVLSRLMWSDRRMRKLDCDKSYLKEISRQRRSQK
jgi:Transcription factor S-II (TFIIS), central domain